MSTRLNTRVLLSVCAVAGLALSIPARSQKHQHEASEAGMSSMCQQMMAERKADEAAVNADRERLESLVQTMEKAAHADRMEAVVAVVRELASQQADTERRMMAMQPRMMEHMGQHMRHGMESMMSCPMMKGDQPEDAAADGNSAHHPDDAP